MKRLSLIVVSLLAVIGMALPAVASANPQVIPLPDGFQPEGIAVGPGQTFYAGSLEDGAIVAGDLRTGESDVLVPGQSGRIAVGMSFDTRSGSLFVAGGPTGMAYIYDGDNGALVGSYQLTTDPSFINDVVVTRTAAYFTNSFAPVIYRVPLGSDGSLPDPSAVEAIPLSGDWNQLPGFNANGIEATPNGQNLIIVSSAGQAVYQVDPQSGLATEIDLGGQPFPNGDGLVLRGKTLYVVQNRLNQIGVISLSPDLSSGTVGVPITDPGFDVPTTAAMFGDSLYVVNARFGTPPTPDTEYNIVEVSAR